MASYNYQYQDFPGAPELTKKSRIVGSLTAMPGYVLFGMVCVCCVGVIVTGIGLKGTIASLITLASPFLILPPVFKKVRENYNEKLHQKYIAKLNVMRDTNPAQYMQIVQELQRRQNAK